MKTLSIPSDQVSDVFRDCISKIRVTKRQPDLLSRMQASQSDVVMAEDDCLRKSSSGDSHLVQRTSVCGKVTKDEMLKVYKFRMARKGAPGRDVYDRLIESAPYDICPYCSQGHVDTLDHYLPESEYPALVVTPINLIPSCTHCNKIKKAYYPSCRGDQLIHPYFDAVGPGEWLAARIVFKPQTAVVFEVVKAVGWSDEMLGRAREHFKKLELARVYNSEAATEVVGIKASIEGLFGKGGATQVKLHLNDQASSWRASGLKPWKIALYSMLSNDDWYCSGGFRAF